MFAKVLLSGGSAGCPVSGLAGLKPSCCLLGLYLMLKGIQKRRALWAVQ